MMDIRKTAERIGSHIGCKVPCGMDKSLQDELINSIETALRQLQRETIAATLPPSVPYEEGLAKRAAGYTQEIIRLSEALNNAYKDREHFRALAEDWEARSEEWKRLAQQSHASQAKESSDGM